MPIFDEGGHTGAARSNILDAILTPFDKDRRKKVPDRRKPEGQEQDDKDEQAKKGSKWF